MPGQDQYQSSDASPPDDVPYILLDEVTERGAYVSHRTGDLIRVVSTGASSGDSELIDKHSTEPIYVTQISQDPFVPISQARIAAANLNIEIKR